VAALGPNGPTPTRQSTLISFISGEERRPFSFGKIFHLKKPDIYFLKKRNGGRWDWGILSLDTFPSFVLQLSDIHGYAHAVY
jgi:hypothetical protein